MSDFSLDQIKLSEIPSDEEWIVEQIDKETCLLHCIGKIFVQPTIHLNTQQLEWAWDLCNYGPAGYELQKVDDDCVYKNYNVIIAKGMSYIPLRNIDHCNDDIFIRKHYDMDNGYWINNNNRTTKDKWVYTSRKAFIEYHKYCKESRK